jgi:signal transduction histidine kinase/serine/threonine protein kinase
MGSDHRSLLQRRLGERFLLTEEIKHSEGISTWLARDEKTSARVVVKLAPTATLSADRLRRLEREALILQDVQNPSLAQFVAQETGSEWTWLVLAYVSGVTLAERILEGPLTFNDGLEIARRLLHVLRDIHDKGILHRDIKPSNVIVNATGPIRSLTLIDFGLARSEFLDGDEQPVAAGTVRYMAPEQSKILPREVGPYTDLYSVAVLLHECLVGKPLFPGDDVGEVLRSQLSGTTPTVRELGVAIPRVFDQWLQCLLRKEPETRYRNAEVALRDLDSIILAVVRGQVESASIVGPDTGDDSRFFLADPDFVGRAAELGVLAAEWSQTTFGRGGLLLVEGESGGGKSRLLKEFSQNMPFVFRGQGVDQAAPGPFRILSGVVAGVVERARRDLAFKSRLVSTLASRAEAICDALPECTEIFGDTERHGLGPESLGEIRSIQALTAFLEALATENDPCLIILDDCQWADDLSLRLISFWQKKTEELVERPRYAMLVAVFRSEEVGPEHRLRVLSHFNSIVLKPLDSENCRDLLESMAGKIPEAVSTAVAQLSHGNPFMASAILHGLVESGTLYRQGDEWTADLEALANAQASRKAGIFLARRLKRFPAETLRLLSIGAVVGKEFSADLVARLASRTAAQVREDLREAALRKVVWPDENGAHYVFAHDKIRETLLALMDTDERIALHLGVARRLESASPDRVYEVAYHFAEAGYYKEALPYALQGAAQARKRHALHVSERYFRIAERGSRFGDAACRLAIAEGLADVLMLLGKYDESESGFQAATQLALTSADRARIQGKAGELAFKRGDVTQAAHALEEALRSLRMSIPRGKFRPFFFLAREVFVQALHSIFPRFFLARRPLDAGEMDFLRARILSRLAYVYWFGSGKVFCAWAHLKEMNLVERYPPTLELAQAYSEHAPVMTMVPWFSRGIAYAEKSLAIRKEFGDLWGQGQSYHFYGVVLYAASRFHESIEKCQMAASLLERTGDRWEVNTASWHIGYANYRLGRMREALDFAQRTYQAGTEIGDHQAAGISLAAWSKASCGLIPPELIRAEQSRSTGDLHTRIEVLQAEAVRLLAKNDTLSAAALLEQAQEIIDRSGFKQEYVAPVLPWLATVLRRRIEQLPIYATLDRKRALRRFAKVVRRARRIARQYPNNLPHALREMGYFSAFSANSRAAKKHFQESIEVARQQGARHEEALSLDAFGQVGIRLGWESAAANLALGQTMLQAQSAEARQSLSVYFPEYLGNGDEPSLSLSDRFSSLLTMGRKIAAALSVDEVFVAVKKAAQTLLRLEECVILDHPESDSTVPIGVSRDLVAETVGTRLPVVFSANDGRDASESMLLSEARSAICAPIVLGERVVACFYGTHSEIGSLFGENETKIAEFICTLASAALENAEGFSRLQRLSEERRKLHQEAEKAIRHRDEFLSIASHELRTPLTSMKLQSQLIHRQARERGIDSVPLERMQKFLELTDKQIGRLNHLIEDLLDVARLNVGRFVLNAEVTEVGRIVADTLARFQPDLKAAGCEVEFRAPARVYAKIDPFRYEQVFINLITNAIKYARGSKIEIFLEARDRRVQLSVRDHGPGIPIEDQTRIFQRFERATVPGASGLGLGLFIAAEIMKAHGGSIFVESSPGAGSTFVVEMPEAMGIIETSGNLSAR